MTSPATCTADSIFTMVGTLPGCESLAGVSRMQRTRAAAVNTVESRRPTAVTNTWAPGCSLPCHFSFSVPTGQMKRG